MALRKITIDNSIKFVPQTKKTMERSIKPKTIKADSLPHKQNKNISQNNKKFFKNVAAQESVSLNA